MYDTDICDDDRRYLTPRWKRLRLAVLARDAYTCQECLRRGESRAADTVHHIEPNNAGLFYDTGNLVSLCGECHNRMHNRAGGELTADGRKWLRRARLGLVKRISLL